MSIQGYYTVNKHLMRTSLLSKLLPSDLYLHITVINVAFLKSWTCVGLRIAYRSGSSVSLHVMRERKNNETGRISVFLQVWSELTDDDSLRRGTCSIVECHS
jgi:hypothetical protein